MAKKAKIYYNSVCTGAAIPVSVFVGTSVVFVILLVLLVAVIMVGLSAYAVNKWKKNRSRNNIVYIG